MEPRRYAGRAGGALAEGRQGAYVPAAKLTGCSQLDMGEAIINSLLDSCGIPHFTRYPHYGGFGNLMLGVSAEGVDVYVPRDHAGGCKEYNRRRVRR